MRRFLEFFSEGFIWLNRILLYNKEKFVIVLFEGGVVV